MAVEFTTVEAWVLVDSDGNYVARADDSDLTEAYEEAHQPIGDRVSLLVNANVPDAFAHVEIHKGDTPNHRPGLVLGLSQLSLLPMGCIPRPTLGVVILTFSYLLIYKL